MQGGRSAAFMEEEEEEEHEHEQEEEEEHGSRGWTCGGKERVEVEGVSASGKREESTTAMRQSESAGDDGWRVKNSKQDVFVLSSRKDCDVAAFSGVRQSGKMARQPLSEAERNVNNSAEAVLGFATGGNACDRACRRANWAASAGQIGSTSLGRNSLGTKRWRRPQRYSDEGRADQMAGEEKFHIASGQVQPLQVCGNSF
ncbi:unnamed protein product [Protopolystoma xenopodis]|uniref:Uncharacterized protein n=1 Tax=Protopolystoma xenopodis TaxID=117903 RepID=A0A3S5BXE4_9PLAT|nr:unnamed protein product [Protopolystoma xenopodis]